MRRREAGLLVNTVTNLTRLLFGVKINGDHELEDEVEYTRIEYAYSLMAKDAGINMSECRLFEENGRYHFMTKWD